MSDIREELKYLAPEIVNNFGCESFRCGDFEGAKYYFQHLIGLYGNPKAICNLGVV